MAKPVKPPEPTLKITVIGPEQGRWRGGFGTPRKFTPEPQTFSEFDLTPEEIEELQADAELKVTIETLGAPVDPEPEKPVNPEPEMPVNPAAASPSDATPAT